MDEQPMIAVEGVTMRFGRHEPLFRDVTFHLYAGEFLYLVGPSGAGKTTLLRLLFRDLVPSDGEVVVAGQNLRRLSGRSLAHFRRRVGVVFQDFKLLPYRTVFQNVALALRVRGMPRRDIRASVDRILARVALTARRDAVPAEISGGEQQRVAIARAAVSAPPILLADEPTGNLDPRISVDIIDLFEGFNLRGTTVVIATHDVARALERGKRIVRLEGGRLREGLL